MNKQLELQLEFQQLAGQKNFTLNRVPTVEERKLRLKLALEELSELAEAYGLNKSFIKLMFFEISEIEDKFGEKCEDGIRELEVKDTEVYNEVEVLDACIDIAIINNGTIITQGHHTIFDREYNNVDTNNKTKFHITYDESLKTKIYYKDKNILTTVEEIRISPFNFYVVKNESGKVVKPWNYEAVVLNLKP